MHLSHYTPSMVDIWGISNSCMWYQLMFLAVFFEYHWINEKYFFLDKEVFFIISIVFKQNLAHQLISHNWTWNSIKYINYEPLKVCNEISGLWIHLSYSLISKTSKVIFGEKVMFQTNINLDQNKFHARFNRKKVFLYLWDKG